MTRVRRGSGFTYLDAHGQRVDDPELRERIDRLAIPPAWREVWICPFENGHLQAVGTDQAGRRQYLYHPLWGAHRSQKKFDEMLAFARALPDLRLTVAAHLEEEGLPRERVLSCAVRLLDLGFFRVGGERYAGENGTYGLATLEKRHVRLLGNDELVFDYTAKHGIQRVQSIVDRRVYETAAALKRRRGGGDAFLAYRNGTWCDVRSDEINAFIKGIAGESFSAKAFRTWHATVLAAVGLAVSTLARSQAARKRAVARAVSEVAHYLGNTPAVCRASYIDPRVVDRYLAGHTIAPALERIDWPIQGDPSPIGEPVEQAVLDLLSPSRS